ncbi:MAG TPA: sigma-70 family RNA polymerase sigma factor [Planctomycetota bacterium]|nr:sigma-70 family RNA polymerase sigma factor [Planctomycetota bacterium]
MDDLHTRFLRLHMAHQRALFGFLLAAVREPSTAEDLLQEVTLVLWKKFGEFRQDAPYLPWAFGIARREVAQHFRDRGRGERCVPLEILDQVTPVLEQEDERLASERGALAACIESLPDPLRDLLRLRYEEGTPLRDLSARLGQSLAAINMRIVRLRRALLDCTRRRLAEEAPDAG